MARSDRDESGSVRLFLCGDVMTGRGIDQVLPHPVDPRLCERFVTDARQYVELAERANGPIHRPVDFDYVWGDVLEEFARRPPDLRIVNLETSITRSEDCAPKGINYRMSPDNVPVLTAAGIDCCALANNHVIDWEREGLLETLETLDAAGIAHAGAGRNAAAAAAPAQLPHSGGGRVLVFSFGTGDSGIPPGWAATRARWGVNRLSSLSDKAVGEIAARVAEVRQPGDIVVASVHWGGNWGYAVPRAQRDFAHALIDYAGVGLVHGHSSHHVKAIEVHNGRLVLYGCGDFLSDYEGIRGYERYRDDLVLMYFAEIDPADGRLRRLEMTPLQLRRFRLTRASEGDVRWLRTVLNREGERFGTRVERGEDNRLTLVWR